MSLKYEILKRLVQWIGLKQKWVGKSTEELLENRRRQNAKNRIPACIRGSDETPYACAPSFEAATKKYSVACRMTVGLLAVLKKAKGGSGDEE